MKNKVTLLDSHLGKTSHLAAVETDSVRDMDLGKCIVDVAMRDVAEEGQYELNIIVYLRFGVTKEEVEPALRYALTQIFGAFRPDQFDLTYQDQKKIKRELGAALQPLDNFCVIVRWPTSALYTVKSLSYDVPRLMKAAL